MVVAVASAGREVLPPRLLPQRQADVMMMNHDEPTGVIMVGSNSEDDDVVVVVVVVMVVRGVFELKDQKVWNFGTWSIVEDDWAVWIHSETRAIFIEPKCCQMQKSLGNFSFWFIFCSGNYAEPPKWYLLMNNTPADRLM